MHTYKTELELFDAGYEQVVGIDEAGRGPLAGPVVAASFLIFEPINRFKLLSEVNDSKKITEKKRSYIYDTLIAEYSDCIHYSVIGHLAIDQLNIFQATMQAMAESIKAIDLSKKTIVLVDGNRKAPLIKCPQKTIIGGDSKIFVIAAASIVAKVVRDKIMNDLDKKYPEYGFAKHKGYGTKEHLGAISKHGPCPIHRRTYAPIKFYK